MSKKQIKWWPQPRQLAFLDACGLAHPFTGKKPSKPKARVIGYGGSAGGGKSDSLLAADIIAALTFPGINIGFFRREYPQLEGPGGAIMRSHELLTGIATWNGGQRRWTFPNKSVLQFCHCKNEDDVFNYQSQQFDIESFDEGTQFTRFQVRYLMTRNRATKPNVTPFVMIGTNPGNIGHAWFKGEFIDPGTPEVPHEVEVEPGQYERHIFIPAKLEDNQILEQRDPGYRKTLEAQPEQVRKQLLEGDWDVFSGQYYPEWRRDIHVIRPIEIPKWWHRYRSLDYGLDTCSCHWWAIDNSGLAYCYRELYQPDLKLSSAAQIIADMTPRDEHISYTVASPDLWNRRQDTGKSGVEVMSEYGLKGLIRADNRRVEGWRELREWLAIFDDEQGVPASRIRFFDTCKDAIRVIPGLIHCNRNPEDVSDKVEDHAAEDTRYFVMSRPARSLTPDTLKERKRRHHELTQPVVSKVTGY